MCRFIHARWILALALGVLAPAAARADAVKHALFVFGVHLAGAEGVAVEFSGDPVAIRPGGMALIKRNLNWAIDVADAMKWPAEPLKTLERDLDRVSFLDIANRLGTMRSDYQMIFAKSINPGAAAYFIIGVQQSGAERIAVGASGFRRDQKPGTGSLIERNLTWMSDGAAGLGLTTAELTKLQEDMGRGLPFADIAARLAKLRLDWQKELSAQPAFGAGGGVAGGTVISRTSASLAKTDPFDSVRRQMHAKVYPVNLRGGVEYVVDVESGDGKAGPNNPGFFDTWVRIEDASGRTLAQDDDGGDGFNARVSLRAPADGNYRIVVTSYASGATGNFTMTVRQR